MKHKQYCYSEPLQIFFLTYTSWDEISQFGLYFEYSEPDLRGRSDCWLTWSFVSFISDKDLKTEGFELESCRSMIALMDVSFASERGVPDSTLLHLSFTPWLHTHKLFLVSWKAGQCVTGCCQITQHSRVAHINCSHLNVSIAGRWKHIKTQNYGVSMMPFL